MRDLVASGRRTGEQACPFTTLYRDFLARHEQRFARHPRLGTPVRQLARLARAERQAIAERAAALRASARDATP